MDNPARTAMYAALTEQRRHDAREFLARIAGNSTASIVWEIGCGHGHFLTAYAQAHRDRPCVGIDISSDRIARAERKRQRSRLPHLHFLQAEASLFLREIPPALSVSTIFILFPDPWPKLRHQKHRILRASFLDDAAVRTTADCRLYFRTDYMPYFRAAAATIEGHASWQLASEPWPFEFETVFQQRAAAHYSLVATRR